MRVGIIGGGPGGSVAAATLAQKGHTVEIFESERFPRFHVGETLLPGTLPIFESIGVKRELLMQLKAVPASGAHFEQVGSGRTSRFVFSDGLPGDAAVGLHVERALLDKVLLQHAIASGAKLRTGARVQRVELPSSAQQLPTIVHTTSDKPSPQGTDSKGSGESKGTSESTQVDFLIDASGREALIATQLKLMERDSDCKRAAVYGHVSGLAQAPGAMPGDLSISKSAQGWAWAVQFSRDTWSVGVVLPRDAILKAPTTQEAFASSLTLFPELLGRLRGQVPTVVRTTPNLSFRVSQRLGQRWAIIGDAGGCLDPVIASGVLLAARAGRTLALALTAGGSTEQLEAWKSATNHDQTTFQNFIHLWYDGQMIDNLFFGNSRDPHVGRGITSLLTGNTTSRENMFLAMIKRRTLALRHKTLIMN